MRGYWRRAGWAACGAAALAVNAPRAARACLYPEPAEFSVDPTLIDVDLEPPSTPTRVNASVVRFSGLFCREGQCISNSCGSGASLSVAFEAGVDDRSPAERLGYRLRFVDGSLPPALEGSLSRIAVGTASTWQLSYDGVVGLDARFELVAIDRAGNESPPSEPFSVAFDGCTRAPSVDGCVEDLPSDEAGCYEGDCFASLASDASCSLAPRGAAARRRTASPLVASPLQSWLPVLALAGIAFARRTPRGG